MTLTDSQIATILQTHCLGPLRHWRSIRRDNVNPAYLINGEIVLRLNTHEPASNKLRKEAALYRRLLPAGLPVPRVLALDTSHTMLPYDLLLLERLQGRDALDLWPNLDLSIQEQLSYEMGQLLATIHYQPCPSYGGFDKNTAMLGGSENWRKYLLDKVAESLISLWQCGGLPTVLLYGAEDYLLRATIPTHPPPALVHGNFGLHKILLAHDGKHWQVSGVFDFEWALAADAEYEFATGLLVEPDEVNPLTTPFLQGYRSMRPLDDGWTRRSAVYRLIYHLTLCAVVWQLYSGDPKMLRYHRGMIVDILKAGV